MLAIFHLSHFPIYYLVVTTLSLFAVSSFFPSKFMKLLLQEM